MGGVCRYMTGMRPYAHMTGLVYWTSQLPLDRVIETWYTRYLDNERTIKMELSKHEVSILLEVMSTEIEAPEDGIRDGVYDDVDGKEYLTSLQLLNIRLNEEYNK